MLRHRVTLEELDNMAAGAAKALSKIISDPLSVFDNTMYGQYSNIPEPKGYWDKISKIFNSYKPRHEDPNFYPNDVKPGMHLTEATTGPDPYAAEERDYINKDLFNSILTDHKRQVAEGINPQDVLSGEDLSKFYNEIYAPGVDSKQAMQNLAEKLFIQRGVESALKKSKSDPSGKIQSFNQKTIKGKGQSLTSQMAKDLISGNYEDGIYTGKQTAIDAEEKKKKQADQGTGKSGFSGFGGFSGFKKQ